MFLEYPDVVSVHELCKMLDIGMVLAYRLIKSGTIKSRKIGREHKILKSDVIAYLQNSTMEDGIAQ